MTNELEKVELYAWVGEDEFGSGTIGLKQAMVPAGLIPLVSVEQDKIGQQYIVDQLQRQANQYGQTIKLCRFVFEDVKIIIDPVGV